MNEDLAGKLLYWFCGAVVCSFFLVALGAALTGVVQVVLAAIRGVAMRWRNRDFLKGAEYRLPPRVRVHRRVLIYNKGDTGGRGPGRKKDAKPCKR